MAPFGRIMGLVIFRIFFTLTLFFTGLSVSLGGPPWEGVESLLGRSGIPEGEGTRFEFPRSDLNVLVQGIPLDPQGMLVSRVSFSPEGKSARLEAALLVLESEAARAMVQANRNGLRVLSCDLPFSNASPQVRCLRLTGRGPRKNLGWAIKMVLASTGTPLSVETPVPLLAPKKDPWVNVRPVLGAGITVGGDLLFRWTADPQDLQISFQKEGNDLALWGEAWIVPGHLDLWAKRLPIQGFQVTAVTRRTDDRPGIWIDFWCLNDEKKTIKSLATLLEEFAFIPPDAGRFKFIQP